MKKVFLSSVFCLLFSLFCFSQDVKFSRIGSDEGLSQASVNCILQDSKGYMWFGTQDGLNKYNGYEMIVYKNDPSDSNSLSSNYIECLYEDRKGTIWIGTSGGGLNAFNPVLNRFTRFQHDPERKNSLSHNEVKCIYEDIKGTYWVGTTYGLNSFNGKTNEFKTFIHKEEDTLSLNGFKVQVIFEDKKKNLWIGTYDGGLNLFDREKETFHWYIDNSAGEDVEFFNRVKDIAQDESDILWIATDNGGLVSFNPSTKKFLQRLIHDKSNVENSISDNRVFSLCTDTKDVLWLGTKSGGVSCYNKQMRSFASYRHNEYDFQSLSNDEVNCVYRDREGNIWIGTEAGGVSVYFPNAARFKHYHRDMSNENSFLSNTIMSILQDSEGLIWVGTSQGGITTIDRLNHKFNVTGKENALSTAKNNSVLSLFEDKDGLIWVGTQGGGVNVLDKKTGKTEHVIDGGAAIRIVQGHGNIIWIGIFGSTGLYAYDKTSKNLTKYSTEEGLSSNRIYCVHEDKDRKVWIGTSDGGLNMLDFNTGKIKIYQHQDASNSISSNKVYCLYDDRKGNMWIGTSNGLNKFEIKSQTFTQYYEKDGLPNSSIAGIQGDKRGNLWISTNKGLTRFNPNIENKEGSAFKNFSTYDGLQGDEFNQGAYFQNKKTGEMFFGGINGFNSFYPDNISSNNHIPAVYITSFKKFGKEVTLDSAISDKKFIELSFRDNFISFEFVALDYNFPAKNKYSYTMDGLDNDWSPPSTRRYVSYTNLPGGNYVFRVKGSNSDGLWNDEGVAIYITIVPPWWKTNAFYAFSVLFSIAFVFGFIRYRTASIQKEKKILEQKVAERTAELAQKNFDITSSIQYAKRIQDAILPTKDQIQKHFPESFVLFKPKDIVSGDFYWFGEKNGRKIAACVDCTGHGVPGAFMSMIGTNLLNQIILENGMTEPAAILSSLNQGVRSALKQGEQTDIETTDGMDIALVSVEFGEGGSEKNNPQLRTPNSQLQTQVQFSSALRHLIIISDNKLEKIDGNKFPIGGAQLDTERIFTNHLKFLKKGDTVYMFSDGYADQFGGEKGKKFMIKRLHQMLVSFSVLPMPEQKVLLEKELETWKGNHSQVDDVLVIGIRI
ncbi:MAG: SpoIIE family protein phosphatase [Bacteroidetes bacterium]|nr:SpoIIE family protein phosphatase [Bacteroidota bacterium]